MSRNPDEIINHQILRWEKLRSITEKQMSRSTRQQPVITISSAYGSHGLMIGKMVADVLGLDLFDRQLVEQIATSASVREKVVQSLDERLQDWISEHIAGQFEGEVFSSSDFLRHLSMVVLTIGRHGNAIIIGRGAQFILDPGSTLRVRTTAPLAARVEAIAQLETLLPAQAQEEVLRKDAERRSFALKHFKCDVSQPQHYDLVLNTSQGTLPHHADLVAYAFLQRFGQQVRTRDARQRATAMAR